MLQTIMRQGTQHWGFEHLAELRPVGLDELNGCAELLTRRDRKYVLSLTQAATLLGQLPISSRVLEIDGMRQFEYRSVYFDTLDLRSYFWTAQRRRLRFKIRTRTYGDTGGWLEVKTRGRRATTVKDQVAAVAADAELTDTTLELATSRLAERTGVQLQPDELFPVLEVRFARTTVLLEDRARLTVDGQLGWGLPDTPLRLWHDFVVIETKSSGVPTSFDRLAWAHGVRPVRISKFGCGMAICYPELQANRWHRMLRGPLGELYWATRVGAARR